MTTELSPEIRHQVEQGILILKQGGVIAFPTDTVYGLGAAMGSEEAIKRIYRLKERPADMPLPLLLADITQIGDYAAEVPAVAWLIVRTFLPGGLTLVLEKADTVPAFVTAGGHTIAMRVPAHEVPLGLARGIGQPVIGTSANLSGRPAPLTAEGVRQQFGGSVDLIIDGGSSPGGKESTIVDFTAKTPVIIRQGAIAWEELERVYKNG